MDPDGLTEEEEEVVSDLRRANTEVRRHEAAHAAAGGAFAGAPSFTFERGPDGQLYAVAGEVSIDAAPVDGDPAATIQKLQTIRSAVLAPSDPSGQDRAIAAQAQAGIQQAQAEMQSQRTAEFTGEGEDEAGTVEESGARGLNPTTETSPPGGDPVVAGVGETGRNNDTLNAVARLINIAV